MKSVGLGLQIGPNTLLLRIPLLEEHSRAEVRRCLHRFRNDTIISSSTQSTEGVLMVSQWKCLR
ncbi:hypothetical protein BJF84_15545 [Rhodococcus sp. CUA-806]|nr:hypothetical protein BJF84_26760 [Rhodococcus sp. CUA-806]OLT31955.1 hypothetical protein BJF84_25970 [Rhodococcus sp. CUA-806]OLT34974.1 hypothetical protein BJF84_15545 [Rhodococcus sp. CUA-806]